MKTNIFYKVAAVINSSPKLGEVSQAEESVRTSATSALTDSLGASATPPNLGGESKEGSVKTHNLTTHIAQRKELRTNGTAAEATLWKMLKARQVMGKKFRRQFSIESYVLDFYCPEVRLAVELDGQPHYTIEGDMHDTDRDEHLLSIHGIRTLRFENCDVFRNPEGVLAEIKEALAASDRPLSPSDSLRPSIAQSTLLPSFGHGSTFSASSTAVVAPNLVEQSDTPSAEVTNCPPKLGGRAKRRGSVMAATFTFALSAFTFLAACSETDEIAPAYNNSPLTITATIPGDVWAVATRAEGESTVTYSDWTLHYTDYTGQAATGTLTATSSQDGTYTLTSGSDLVWAKVQDTQDADETFHLTCKDSDGATYYATTTAAHGAATVAFNDAMTPTLAKLTVNFTLSHNMATAPEANDFVISINAKMEADSYDPMTHGGTWPAADGDAATTAFTLSQQSAATGTYTITGSILLPQQTMGNTMIVTYKETTWTLDLSAVAVTGGVEGQKANQLIAGQHLTLNLKAGLTAINTPSDIQIEAFTAADADDYTPDLGSVAKTYEYDADNNTYYIYHEKFIEAALADMKANADRANATVMMNGAEWTIVDGTVTDLATVQAAISEKTHIIVTGETLAAYTGNYANTVLGEAIRTSGAASGTVSLILPAATTIGESAFYRCTALTNVSAPAATSIGNNAFVGCTALTSVSLPATTTIGESAFYRCNALESVELPLAKTIGEKAFSYCTSLTEIELPKATEIGELAFSSCDNLASVSLPSATSIGHYAFSSCSALTSVSLPAAETIGNAAFKGCTALKSVSAPSATSIGNYAFYGCTALKSVSLPAATTIGESAFYRCNALESVSLPSATTIGSSAFSSCDNLASVSLPSATLIGGNAFRECKTLESASLDAAETIGNYAFDGCTALKSVSAPSATSIGNYAFYGCTALKSVSLPAATTIGESAFYRCNALESVSLPSATTIGSSAFSSCDNLASVSLPSATLIGGNAFRECKKLESASLDAAETIGDNAFAGCTALQYVSAAKAKSIGISAFYGCTALASVSLDAATTIGESAFYRCTALTNVSAPAATSIGNNAFYRCDALTSVSAPKATEIGNNAFQFCTALTSVSLDAAETIGDDAFYGCTALASVSLDAATTIGNHAFNNCTSLTTLTFGSVITSLDVPFGGNISQVGPWTEQCDLTLAAGQQHINTSTGTPNGKPVTAADGDCFWAGKYWKSITLK